MADNPDQIKNHIKSAQRELGSNLQELEDKVKGAADWRVQFDKHPVGMLGMAVGGGILLSVVVGGARRPRQRSSDTVKYGSVARPASESTRQKTSATWDDIKGTLVGMAVASLRTFLDDAIPGLMKHYDKAQQAAGRSYGPAASGMDHEIIH